MADKPGTNGRRGEPGLDALIRTAREGYNPPPETPREEIWAAIQDRLPSGSAEMGDQAGIAGHDTTGAQSSDAVADMGVARRRRAFRLGGPMSWAAAAGIVLLMGIGIGRFTAPETVPGGAGVSPRTASSDVTGAGTAGSKAPVRRPTDNALHVAALRHLGRTESLLTMVRAEGRSGSLDPQVGSWARTLLMQTRFLLDAQTDGSDPAVRSLMEDLELVLAQIVGVTESETTDQSRSKAELDLALGGLDEKEVLTRIQAVS